jgi:hypothetical protein
MHCNCVTADDAQDSRISIEGIITHPWFTKKLPPKYDAALQQLRADQAAMDRAFTTASLDVKKRDEDLHVSFCTLHVGQRTVLRQGLRHPCGFSGASIFEIIVFLLSAGGFMIATSLLHVQCS